MSFSLNHLVIAGEFYNTRQFSVHGRLALRGAEMTILVELTGSPGEDLRGRAFEFEVPENDRPPTDEDRKLAARFVDQQIGPTGRITLTGFAAPSEERLRQTDSSEAPQATRLYMEWFSQNGQVVLDLADPKLTFIDISNLGRSAKDAESDPNDSSDPFEPELIEPQADDEIDPLDSLHSDEDEPADEEEDEYGLFPKDLNRDLERSSRRADTEIASETEEESDPLAEMKKFEQLSEHSEGTAVRHLLTRMKLPDPKEWHSEKDTEAALKTALAEIAMFGIAFHICEHCTIRDAYRIFMEEVAEKCGYFPQMRGSSFVQHYTTSDYCEICRSE